MQMRWESVTASRASLVSRRVSDCSRTRALLALARHLSCVNADDPDVCSAALLRCLIQPHKSCVHGSDSRPLLHDPHLLLEATEHSWIWCCSSTSVRATT